MHPIYEDRTNDDFYPLCPKCRYPLLKLRGFEGISSADNIDLRDERYNFWMSFSIPGMLWRALRTIRRRRKVKRLQKEVLQAHPFSLICPQCLTLVKRP